MAKMKRSEFKSLVKECVRECLREIMQEQIVPPPFPTAMPMQELAPLQGQLINPMDDYQMRLRQEMIRQQQQGMMQQQLQRQATQSPLRQQLAPLSELAGLGPGDVDDPRRYNTTAGSGYTNPSDRLRLAAPQQMRIDPSLDTPPAGSMRYNQMQQQQQHRPLRLDPDLDTPLNGGEMRAPDPSVMKNIFEDTARTTFLKQAAAGHVRPGASDMGGEAYAAAPADKFAEIVSQHNPEDLFPGAQNWGALAFK